MGTAIDGSVTAWHRCKQPRRFAPCCLLYTATVTGSDAQRAGMIDPSLKRAQRRRVQVGTHLAHPPTPAAMMRSVLPELPHGGQPCTRRHTQTHAAVLLSCCPVARPTETSPPAWFQGPGAVTALCQDRQCLPPKDVDCRSPRCTHGDSARLNLASAGRPRFRSWAKLVR